MEVEIIPIKDLSEDLKKQWVSMKNANPQLRGPFFHPEHFAIIGQYHPDVFLALFYDKGHLIGIFPFYHKPELRTAKAIDYCNYEAVICYPNQIIDMNKVMKQSHLKNWEVSAFANLGNIKYKTGQCDVLQAARIDISQGLEKYWNYIQNKKVKYKSSLRDREYLAKNLGPIRFVADCKDIKVLHTLIKWKVDRFDSNMEYLRLSTQILEHLYHLENPSLKGMLSALYAGDELLGACFAVRSEGVYGGIHSSFNPVFAKHSVGIILLQTLINEYQALGYTIFDLGIAQGWQYKIDYSNCMIPILKGAFETDSLKKRIKSVKWINESILSVARLKGKIATKLPIWEPAQ